jgi:hypothetical protein
MSTVVTLTLPDATLQRAHQWAKLTGMPLDDLLAQAVELSLAPVAENMDLEVPIEAWTDEKVLAAAGMEMSPTEDSRLSDLLYSQQAGTLTEAERAELRGMMARYHGQLFLKARGLCEAVRRGLREPLQP